MAGTTRGQDVDREKVNFDLRLVRLIGFLWVYIVPMFSRLCFDRMEVLGAESSSPRMLKPRVESLRSNESIWMLARLFELTLGETQSVSMWLVLPAVSLQASRLFTDESLVDVFVRSLKLLHGVREFDTNKFLSGDIDESLSLILNFSSDPVFLLDSVMLLRVSEVRKRFLATFPNCGRD